MTVKIQNKIKQEWQDSFHNVSRCEAEVINKEIMVLDIQFEDGSKTAKEIDPEVFRVVFKNS